MGRGGGEDRSWRKKKEILSLKHSSVDGEIQSLSQRMAEANQAAEAQNLRNFTDLPISQKTLKGLNGAGYTTMKDVQKASIMHQLNGKDVLVAAKTGSGKTLSFLIPMMERLFKEKWGAMDGLGGLVIAPTRELAIQIFEVLRKVGRAHDLSAGLVIGGKDVESEQERIRSMNILVATPGRLLQHMDQTWGFETANLRVLVLDEADRILDLGFSATINAIIENLPQERQTCLFSATLSKTVRDLARLSLKKPEYISVHDSATFHTPTRLLQHYMVLPEEDKLDTIWSFIKSHLKSKMIIFLSSCNQVRFLNKVLCKMQPGIVVSELHGKIKQEKRFQIFQDFVKRKESVLIATDVAARGLDFPEVDWVVQYDCPEDVHTYIHRVGRTARNESKGKSLLFLTESELKMADLVTKARVPIKRIQAKKSKIQALSQRMPQLLSADAELKHLAQKALVSYVRSIFLQGNKEVFQVEKVGLEALSASWGLPTLPKMKFVSGGGLKAKNIPYALRESEEGDSKPNEDANPDSDAEDQDEGGVKRGMRTAQPNSKMTKLFNRKNHDVLSGSYRKLVDDEAEDDSDDDEIFKVAAAPKHTPVMEDSGGNDDIEDLSKRVSKRSMKKITKSGHGNRKVFDEEGNAVNPLTVWEGSEDEENAESHAHKLQQKMALRDLDDKAEFMRRQKQKKLDLKIKLKKMGDGADEEGDGPGEQDSGESSSEDSAGGDQGGRSRGRLFDDSDDSDEEERSKERKTKSAKGKKDAVKSMEAEELADSPEKKKKKRKKGVEAAGFDDYDGLDSEAGGGLSLEDSALALLQKRRRF